MRLLPVLPAVNGTLPALAALPGLNFTNEFHAAQDGHCPCHFRVSAPHCSHRKISRVLDIYAVYKSVGEKGELIHYRVHVQVVQTLQM